MQLVWETDGGSAWRWKTERGKKARIVVKASGEPPRAFLESVRLYEPEEVTVGLRWAGLEVASLYGNFAGDLYERDSERLILTGSKPA